MNKYKNKIMVTSVLFMAMLLCAVACFATYALAPAYVLQAGTIAGLLGAAYGYNVGGKVWEREQWKNRN